MNEPKNRYHVEPDWFTVVPLGDALAIRAAGNCDERWVKAFEVVRDENQRDGQSREWGSIDFEYGSGANGAGFVLYVRQIKPGAQSLEVRRTVNDLMKAANAVAQIGTHVYELARELRGDQPATGRPSTPPPARERQAEERNAA
jgi:hypothetical protein